MQTTRSLNSNYFSPLFTKPERMKLQWRNEEAYEATLHAVGLHHYVSLVNLLLHNTITNNYR